MKVLAYVSFIIAWAIGEVVAVKCVGIPSEVYHLRVITSILIVESIDRIFVKKKSNKEIK